MQTQTNNSTPSLRQIQIPEQKPKRHTGGPPKDYVTPWKEASRAFPVKAIRVRGGRHGQRRVKPMCLNCVNGHWEPCKGNCPCICGELHEAAKRA